VCAQLNESQFSLANIFVPKPLTSKDTANIACEVLLIYVDSKIAATCLHWTEVPQDRDDASLLDHAGIAATAGLQQLLAQCDCWSQDMYAY